MAVAARTTQLAKHDLEIVDDVVRDLGLHVKQVAQIVGVDESTLHRWISGATPSGPRQVYRSRLIVLEELHEELLAAFRTPEVARKWFWEERPPAFRGATAAELVLSGRLERVAGFLENLNNGMMS